MSKIQVPDGAEVDEWAVSGGGPAPAPLTPQQQLVMDLNRALGRGPGMGFRLPPVTKK
jgi:hypothetical protein